MIFLISFLFTYIISTFLTRKSFYGDDLSEYLIIKDTDFFSYCFSFDSRVRPLSNIFIYLEFFICRNNILMIYIYNILMFSITSTVFAYVVLLLSKSNKIMLLFTILFVISRFSWYNISQVIGQMENVCIILTLIIVIFINKYINNPNRRYFIVLLILYLAILLSHERYFVFIVPLFLLMLVKTKEYGQKYLYSTSFVLVLSLYQFFKTVILGISFAVDTGGTNPIVIDLLSLINNFFVSFKNVLIIPDSLDYLVGTNFDNLSYNYQVLAYIVSGFNLLLFLFLIVYFVYDIDNKDYKNLFGTQFFIVISFVAILAAVSVSHRIEMRFLFSCYILMLLLQSIIYRRFVDKFKFMNLSLDLVFLFFFALTSIFDYHMIIGATPYYYIIQNNSISSMYYDAFIKENIDSNKKIGVIIKDNDGIDFQGKDIYGDLNRFFSQYEFDYILIKYEINLYSKINDMDFDDYNLYFYDSDLVTIKKMSKSNIYKIENEWTEENQHSILAFSGTGKIYLQYYVPENMLHMEYDIYINNVLIYSKYRFDIPDSYVITYEDECIKDQFFVLNIVCKETYNPSLHNIPDNRNLNMYIVLFDSYY